MKKRIHILLITAALFGSTPAQAADGPEAPDRVRFLVFTDLHHDLMPGGEQRLRTIVDAAEREQVDFMLDLGDFVFPKPENRVIPDILSSTPLKTWHVLGNHDMDVSDKQTYMDFVGMEAPFYSFRKGVFHFLVLDTNHFLDAEGEEHDYDTGNYYGQPVREHITVRQAEWLRGMLSDPEQVYVVVSHAPVNDGYDRVEQYREIHRILTEAKAGGIRIAVAMAGHIHSDNFHEIDGVNYWQVNSASYIWGGEAFESTAHYPDSVYARYGSLRYIIPYEEALYAVVEISADGRVDIRGVQGRFKEPAPDPEKLKRKPYPCSASIEDRSFGF